MTKALIENIFLAAIVGLGGLAVSFLGSMSENIQKLTVSVQELNIRMEAVTYRLDDHETRLRHVERP